MKRTSRKTYLAIASLLLVLATLGCNLLNPASPTGTPPPATPVPAGLPELSVLWPPNGSEFAVRQEVTVRVSASDRVGITRLELRAPNMMLSSVPSPERNGQPTMDAILSWTPTRSGAQDLEVVAYRGGIASEPVALNIVIRARAAEIRATPIPYGVTQSDLGILPGTECQARVNIDNLRYRAGPGTEYAILGILDLGETLSITAQNTSGTWYRALRNNQTIWVSANTAYITELSSCANAPVAG